VKAIDPADIAEIKYATADEVCDWLKGKYKDRHERGEFTKRLQSEEYYTAQNLQKKIESILIERGVEKIDFYLCKYGVNPGIALEKFHAEATDDFILDDALLAALSNFHFFEQEYISAAYIKKLIEKFPESEMHLDAALNNIGLDRDVITTVLEWRGKIQGFYGEDFLIFFAKLIKNSKACNEKYEMNISDPLGDLRYGKLFDELSNLVHEIKPSLKGYVAATRLLDLTYASTQEERISDFLNKWTTEDKELESNFGLVRYVYSCKVFSALQNDSKQREFFEKFESDNWVRRAFYSSAQGEAIFGSGWNEIPNFKKLEKSDYKNVSPGVISRVAELKDENPTSLSKNDKLELTILNYFLQDLGEFIFEICLNKALVVNYPELLRRMCFDLPWRGLEGVDAFDILRRIEKDLQRANFQNDGLPATKTETTKMFADVLSHQNNLWSLDKKEITNLIHSVSKNQDSLSYSQSSIGTEVQSLRDDIRNLTDSVKSISNVLGGISREEDKQKQRLLRLMDFCAGCKNSLNKLTFFLTVGFSVLVGLLIFSS
jgi:hypothetical protein